MSTETARTIKDGEATSTFAQLQSSDLCVSTCWALRTSSFAVLYVHRDRKDYHLHIHTAPEICLQDNPMAPLQASLSGTPFPARGKG